MMRTLDDWLQSYLEYSEESESPREFHLWTGLSVLASAIRRNIWINQGIYQVYPNLYVILVGPPGTVAKSTCIRMGRKILLGVEDVFFAPESLTREELIRVMAKAGSGRNQSAVTIHSTELSSLIQPSGIKMIQFLTDIYDGDFKFRYATKHSGRDTILNPVVNILAATTPSWIADELPVNVVEHGFTSRTIFVYGDKPRRLNPFPKGPDEKIVERLMSDLREIARVEGEMVWGDGAKETYARLYEQIMTTKPRDYRLAGYHARKRIHVLKVGMLLSMARGHSLLLTVRDLEDAWEILQEIEPQMSRTFSAVGKYEYASDLERIEARIREENGMTTQQIFEEFFSVGDIQELTKILVMLINMGRIKRVKGNDGESIYLPV